MPLSFRSRRPQSRAIDVIQGALSTAGMKLDADDKIVGKIDYFLGWFRTCEARGYVEMSDQEHRILVVLNFEARRVFSWRDLWLTLVLFVVPLVFFVVWVTAEIVTEYYVPGRCRETFRRVAESIRSELEDN
jgi:hypothetical protein